MKKILFLALLLIASISYGQMTPLGGNTPTLGGSPGAGGGGGAGPDHFGTANQVTVVNGSGTVTFSTPQNIHAGADVTFASMTLSGLLDGILSSTGGVITGGAGVNLTSDVSGVLPIANGGTNSSTALNNDRLMMSVAGAVVEAGALTNGQLFIGSTGAAPSAASVTGTANQVTVSNGAGTITLSAPQDIHTGASPTFLSATFSGLTASEFIKTDGASGLTTVTNIDLTSDITGTLPIANGGTNSSTALNNDRVMLSNTGAIVESAALTDGQFLIGSTGATPAIAALTATANQTTITNGSGSVTIGTAQDIHTGASPTFLSGTFSGLADGFVQVSGGGALFTTPTTGAASIDLLTEVFNVLPIANGGTNSATALNNDRHIISSGGAIVESAAATDGQLLIGSTGSTLALASIAATANQTTVTNGSNTITIGTAQDIAAGSSPTFLGATLSGLAASQFVVTDGSSALAATATIPFASTTGIVPIARGGTNSSTALNNDRLLLTTGGAIVEANALSDGEILIGSTGGAPAGAAITGTVNQVSVTNGSNSIVLALPQDLHTGASPTFASLNSANLTLSGNQLSSNDVNGDVIVDPNGTGEIILDGPVTITGAVSGGSTFSDSVITVNDTNTQATADANNAGLLVSMTDATNAGLFYDSALNSFFSIGEVGAEAEVVTVSNMQTLTNKTITSIDNIVQADEVRLEVRNVTGSQIDKGSLVYVDDWNNGQGVAEVALADADSAATMPSIGMVAEDIPNNSNGEIIITGYITQVDTLGFANADELYVSTTAGAFTNVRPTGANELVQKVGDVGRVHGSQGTIILEGSGHAEDLPNSPTIYANLSFPNLTVSKPLVLDGAGVVTSQNVSLTSQVTGTLPIANGGTNSGTALNGSRMMLSTATQVVEGAALTDGQIFIGQTGGAPTGAALTGTANQVNITNASGSITLSTPQDIDATASPTFASATFSNLVDGFVKVANNGELYTSVTTGVASVDLASEVFGILPIANGGTNSAATLNNDRMLVTSGGAIVESSAATDGQLLMGATGGAPVLANVNGTANQVTVTNGSGSISLSLPQDIHTGASPTFTGATLSGLTANQFVFTDGASALVSAATIDFASVTGIVPVAQGGTASSAALTNGKLMQSVGGAIVEDAELITNNSEAALEVSSTKAFILPRLTTGQRDALTPEAGMVLFNSTISQTQYYNGTGWISY